MLPVLIYERRKAIDLSNTRSHGDLNPDGPVLQLPQPVAVRGGRNRLGRSDHLEGSSSVLAVALLFALALLLALPVGSAFADAAYSYTFDSNMQGWSTSGSFGWYSGGGGVVTIGGSPGYMTSPAKAARSGITGIHVQFTLVSGNPAWLGNLVTYVAGVKETESAPTCTGSAPYTCTWDAPAGASVPAATQSYTVTIAANAPGGSTAYIDNVTITEVGASPPPTPCTGNCINYPQIDLPTISTNVGSFFNYLSPLLYVVGGIGLGGLIVAKARHLF